MGVTISFRGRLDRLDSIEEIQDRALEMALAVGGRARFWQSRGDGPAPRRVRGVIIDLAPGCDTVSLLFSPEGRLVPLFEIEAAERGPLADDVWVFVKTQYAPPEAHVALVRLLRLLKERFASDLDVLDEGEYWETGDLGRLLAHRGTIERGLDALEGGLRAFPLSAEACEDADIVAARVERVAAVVMESLRRAPEHPPVRAEEGDPHDGSEAFWDATFRENVRRVERLSDMVSGADPRSIERARRAAIARDAAGEEAGPGDVGAERAADTLLARVEALLLTLPREVADADGLAGGLCEALGGLAQAADRESDECAAPHGLRVVQLKRALRGLTFARGAAIAARAGGASSTERVLAEIDAISDAAIDRLRALRIRLPGGA